jgi:hypothetical protein
MDGHSARPFSMDFWRTNRFLAKIKIQSWPEDLANGHFGGIVWAHWDSGKFLAESAMPT